MPIFCRHESKVCTFQELADEMERQDPLLGGANKATIARVYSVELSLAKDGSSRD